MRNGWRQIEDESERAEGIAAAQERYRQRRRHAEESNAAAQQLPSDGEIWVHGDTAEQITVWALMQGPQAMLIDVAAPHTDPADAWPRIRALAERQGWRQLKFGAFHSDDLLAAMAEVAHAARVATKMQRPTADVAEPEGIRTVDMTESEFASYCARMDRSYAESLLASGSAPDMDAALAEAAASMGRLLPDGLQTPDQHLWTVRDHDDAEVGVLWVHQQRERAFIYDIEMKPDARGRGYGTQALRAAAAHAREAGRPAIALNVFGHNDGARRLYAREGYRETEVIWAVEIG